MRTMKRVRAMMLQWRRRELIGAFDDWLSWVGAQVSERKLRAASTLKKQTDKQKMLLVVQKLRLRSVSQAMSAWRGYVLHSQVDAANTALLEGLTEVQKTLVREMADAEAVHKAAVNSTNKQRDKQRMLLVVQKLRLRSLAQAMGAWRGYTLRAQVDAANTALLEGLTQAQAALVGGLAEAEAEVKSTSAELQGENAELEDVLDDIVQENKTVTARCTELAGVQQSLEMTSEELSARAAAAETLSAALTAEIEDLRAANTELNRVATEFARENPTLIEDKNVLVGANADLTASVAEIKRQLAAVSPAMEAIRGELASSEAKQEEMQQVMATLNEELEASLQRETLAEEETTKLRFEVMVVAEQLKDRSMKMDAASPR